MIATVTSGTDYKAKVLQATDIVELIGQSVALKRRGTNFVGLCPFHQEKTPSFNVNPARQLYKCFGCGAHGNAIDFVIQRDRVEFIDALKTLGQQAGIDMPKYGVSKEKTSEKQVLLEANSAACEFFEKLLSHPQDGLAAREYLTQRGFNAESIRRFQVGLAINSWDALLGGPVGRKFSGQQLATAGLAKPRENGGGFYDTFRNRLMFPIRDEAGRVIAFGGRVMPGSQDPAKYLNSPETPLFSKSGTVFGLDLARPKIVETGVVAIVEGYTDVVMAHQYGASNVVSVLGTALTEQHVAKLKRYLPEKGKGRIVLLFDADSAGDNAANRAVELFLTQPVEIAIASMPDGLDPDEFLLEKGVEAFDKMLADAEDALSYKWRLLARDFGANQGNMTAQQQAVEAYLESLAASRGAGPVDSMRWGSALARVSRLTDIPMDELNRRFKSKGQRSGKKTVTQVTEGAEPTIEARPRFDGPLNAQDRAERWILGILLAQPQRWTAVQQVVRTDEFADPTRRKLAEIYWAHQRDEGEPVLNEFISILPDATLSELAVDLVEEIDQRSDAVGIDETLAAAVGHLKHVRQRREEQKTIAELRRTNDDHLNEQSEVALLQKLQEQARRPDLRRAGS